MNIKMKYKLILGCLVFAFCQVTQAQFAGDIFFAEPSVSVSEGEEVQVELLTFSGAVPFGAVQVELDYDPTQLEITQVEKGNAVELQSVFKAKQLAPGKASFIAVNSDSTTSPIGTVSIATFVIKPLVSAGSLVNVSSNVIKILDADSNEYGQSNGFGLEVAVTAASQTTQTLVLGQSTASLSLTNSSVADDQQRARRLRPAGSIVELKEPNTSSREVKVIDPTIPVQE